VKPSIIKTVVIAMALLLFASVSFALENKSPATGEADEATSITRAKAKAKTADAKSAKAKRIAKEKEAKAKAAAKAKQVDINSASKEALKKLPGIGDAEADKIIASRPYLTKAHLLTHKVLPDSQYEPIKRLIVAKQKQNPAAKPSPK
jgi:DNA uptake protein ComE-like DNA-binding protein